MNRHRVLLAILSAAFVIMSVTSMRQKSGTCDEIAHHIPAGYSYYQKWDFRLNPSNPPLSRYIMALPLQFMGLKAPFEDQSWLQAETPTFGQKFFFQYNKGQSLVILFASRLTMVVVGLITGFGVYLLAKYIWGVPGGVCAFILYCFSPEILAHSTLATTDITAACTIIFSLFTFFRFLRRPDYWNVFVSALALGLAQLSKNTSLVLYPIFVVIAAIEGFGVQRGSRIIRKLLLIFIVSVLVIWAGYGFRMRPFLSETTQVQDKVEFVQSLGRSIFGAGWNASIAARVEGWLKKVPLPLTTYIMGIFGVWKHSSQGHRTFFMGRWSDYGHPLYYAVAFLIKTPIPLIISLLLAIISLRFRRIKRQEAYILLCAAILFLTASLNRLQLGIRYILPVYPLCFIFISRLVGFLNTKVRRLAASALLVWLVAIPLVAWPNYLSYFNEFIGGPENGWKYLRDSNIDWGQDLPTLAKYLNNNKINEIALLYFGEDDPHIYGINFRKLNEEETKKPTKTAYAISVQYLDWVGWAKNIPPTAKAGYSIFIYDFRAKNGS